MDDNTLEYLKQLRRVLSNGGEAEEIDLIEGHSFQETMLDLHRTGEGLIEEIIPLKIEFARLVVFIYREARRQKPMVARTIWESWLVDFPGTEGTRVLRQWGALMRASKAAQQVALSENEILILQTGIEMHRAFNEFISGLLGFLIAGLQVAAGENVNRKVFGWSYAKRLNEYRRYIKRYPHERSLDLIDQVVRKPFRNAVAHSDVEHRKDLGLLLFSVKENGQQIHLEMDVLEFTALVAVYSHLHQAYLAAITILATFEGGTPNDLAVIPQEFKTMLSIR